MNKDDRSRLRIVAKHTGVFKDRRKAKVVYMAEQDRALLSSLIKIIISMAIIGIATILGVISL